MAGKVKGSVDFDEQFLTCPVCMLHFRDPKVLPCLHTFCKECLQRWTTKQQQPLECPTCRTQVSLPDQGVDGLRGNFYVNSLLDFAAAKKGAQPGVACHVCEGGQDGVKSWCADCAVLLCESCAKMHCRIPALNDHKIVPQEAMKTKNDMEKFRRKKHCSKHRNQELTFYCKSCETLICTACTVIDHRPGKDHNTVEISPVAQTKKESLESLMEQLTPRLKGIHEALEEIDKEKAKLPISREKATDEATTYFRHLVDIVKIQEAETLAQIDTTCQKITKSLDTQKSELEFDETGMKNAYEFCKQAVEHGSDVHIVEVEGQVQKRVEDLLAKRTDMTPRLGEVDFVKNTNVTDFEKQLTKLVGVVAKRMVDVSKCTVVVKPAVVGFDNVCLLNTNDKNGQPCHVRCEDITANLKDSLGKLVQSQLEQTGEGTWEISYMPHDIGKYVLEVTVKSQHLAGSPVGITVQSRNTPVLAIGRARKVNKPVGVVVDKDGNIAVVGQGNKRVWVFDVDKGHFLKSFSVEGEGSFDIDVDSNGRFLVTSWGGSCGIRCYSQEGKLLNTFKPSCMTCPYGVAVLEDGRIIVADKYQKSCLLLQHDGSLIREVGKRLFQEPWFIAVDESRDLFYVTDNSAHVVSAFDLTGNHKFTFGKQGQNDGEFQSPSGIALDQSGNIIVLNRDDGRLQVFGPDGTFKQKIATIQGGESYGITMTPDGCIAVARLYRHCVEKYRYS
ncbi:tripartite motif-containing protein 2-like [Branchiostoma lanceolatum]|uniref:tripartite motif-containing protein 2-like n=1 Tax=Branchiostoma lanceolatum TaxID=7740 RepID=UPI00345455CA